MNYATAKRISDGLLGWSQSYEVSPNESLIIINMGVNVLGGVESDYVYQELTAEQNSILITAIPARSKLVDGVVIPNLPILITMDKTSIESDGIDAILLSINTQDNKYNDTVNVKIRTPAGDIISTDLICSAGIAEDSITTLIDGIHYITVETVLHGLQFMSFEGI